MMFRPAKPFAATVFTVSLAMLLGCPANPPSTPSTRVMASPKPALSPSDRPQAESAVVTGLLRVPASIRLGAQVSLGDARLVSNNGSALISNNAGAMVSKGGAGLNARWTLTQTATKLQTVAVKGAKIMLTDATGRPLPALQQVVTGEDGSFTFPKAPSGYSFQIVAEVPTEGGDTAKFRTLVHVSPFGANTLITAGSTLVTTGMLDGMQGNDLGNYNGAKFQSAIDTLDDRLRDDQLPDFTNMNSVKASIDKLSQDIAELRSLLSELRQDIAKVQKTLEELSAKIDKVNASPITPSPAMVPVTPGPVVATVTPTPLAKPVASGPGGTVPTTVPVPPAAVVESPIAGTDSNQVPLYVYHLINTNRYAFSQSDADPLFLEWGLPSVVFQVAREGSEGLVPLYQLHQVTTGAYMLSTYRLEGQDNGFQLQSKVGFIATASGINGMTVPVYRLYDGRYHRLARGLAAANELVKQDWQREGVLGYVF